MTRLALSVLRCGLTGLFTDCVCHCRSLSGHKGLTAHPSLYSKVNVMALVLLRLLKGAAWVFFFFFFFPQRAEPCVHRMKNEQRRTHSPRLLLNAPSSPSLSAVYCTYSYKLLAQCPFHLSWYKKNCHPLSFSAFLLYITFFFMYYELWPPSLLLFLRHAPITLV